MFVHNVRVHRYPCKKMLNYNGKLRFFYFGSFKFEHFGSNTGITDTKYPFLKQNVQKRLTIISLVLFFAFLFSCSQSKNLKKTQQKYLPKVVSNLYLNLPYIDFKKIRGENNLEINETNKLTLVREIIAKDSITTIQYQFGEDKLLYEMIIEYIPKFDAIKQFTEKYGEPNNEKEWLFVVGKNMKLKIWIFKNRLCIGDSKHFKKSP